MTTALTRARRGAALALVGALLLASPAYLGLVVEEQRSRSPTGYTATAIEPANASDQRTLLRTVGSDDVLHVEHLARGGDDGPYGGQYRAPAAAAEVLRRASSEGEAATSETEAVTTLRRLLANHRYVATGDRESPQFYRTDLADDADGGVTVTLAPVDRATVARHVLYRDVVRYRGLPEYQRETVDEVLAAPRGGYRPYNEQFDELTDDVLLKDGTYYVFETGLHVDDFGPSTKGMLAFFLGVAGVLAALAGAMLTGVSYLGDGDGDDGAPGHV